MAESSFEASNSKSNRIRLEASLEGSRLRYYLPNWVSRWERSSVEDVLHIYYEKWSCPMQDILEKIPQLKNVSNQQEQHIEILKNPQFSPDLDFISTKSVTYVHDPVTTRRKILEAVEMVEAELNFAEHHHPGDTTSSTRHSSLSPFCRSYIFIKIHDYIDALGDLVDAMLKIEKTEDGFKVPFEDAYSKVVRAFAAMCGLNVKNGGITNQSVWDHLRGMDKEIISRPDFRFHCTGENFNTAGRLLTVLQVKNRSQATDKEISKRKWQESSYKRAKRRRETESNSSYSSSSSQLTNLSPVSPEETCIPETESNYIPIIEIDVGMHTLGQHAGELLLDLHTYMKENTGAQKSPVLTMPGMIVAGNMVYLTLLVISYEHYEKLAGNEELTSEDRATIYYSHPHSMLRKEERSLLIDSFVRLNNMESTLM